MDLVLSSGTVPAPAARPRVLLLAPVALALAAYLILAYPLRNWLVDDAAISLAYAINWSSGHGLVSQSGMPPVEGYSNFLWVAGLAGLNLLGAATVPGVKLLSLACTAAALVSLNATCRPLMSDLARLAALALTATCSSVVTWTASGLENPLTLLLACEVLRATYLRQPVYLGALIAALGMTRPEGILFGALPLLFFRGRALVQCWGVTAALFGAFLGFRWSVFGDVVPNTFYAKAASQLNLETMQANGLDLLAAPFGHWVIFVAVLGAACFADRKKLTVPLAMMLLAGGIFVLMPSDWMADRRFATPFMPAAFVFTGIALNRARVLLLALLAISVTLNAFRLTTFYAAPTLPMATVQETSEQFDQRARALGLTDASVLLPDIGAALLTSDLKVYDLAGLCDRVIARSLHSPDKSRLHDYVFGELRPTFIRTHSYWSKVAALDSDPRFGRDYVALSQHDFVRRDVLLAARHRGSALGHLPQ